MYLVSSLALQWEISAWLKTYAIPCGEQKNNKALTHKPLKAFQHFHENNVRHATYDIESCVSKKREKSGLAWWAFLQHGISPGLRNCRELDENETDWPVQLNINELVLAEIVDFSAAPWVEGSTVFLFRFLCSDTVNATVWYNSIIILIDAQTRFICFVTAIGQSASAVTPFHWYTWLQCTIVHNGHWILLWRFKMAQIKPMYKLCLENLENNVLKRVADQQLKRWFPAGAHSCTYRKTGSAYCYLRTSSLISPTWNMHRSPTNTQTPHVR